jgi:hypothetical protein
MKLPRVRISVDWVDITKKDAMVVVVMMAVAFVVAGAWSKGSSIIGFESPYWDPVRNGWSRRHDDVCPLMSRSERKAGHTFSAEDGSLARANGPEILAGVPASMA